MDLRKSILKKQNVLNDSLNVSLGSNYESAAEDGDTTMYYSFTNDSLKSIDASTMTIESENENHSLCSEEDKENNETIIQRPSFENIQAETGMEVKEDDVQAVENMKERGSVEKSIQTDHEIEDLKEIQEEASPPAEAMIADETPQIATAQDENKDSEVGQLLMDDQQQVLVEKAQNEAPASSSVETMVMDGPEDVLAASSEGTQPAADEMAVDVPEIAKELDPNPTAAPNFRKLFEQARNDSPDSLVEVRLSEPDPNVNIVNPFITIPPVVIVEPPAAEKRVTRRSVLANKIPTKLPFYSPVLRKSQERRSKDFKPTARRTLLVEASAKPGSSKTPTLIPKPKPPTFKCTVTGCSVKLPSLAAYHDHRKSHKATASALSTFACKWCDKKFQLDAALLDHQTEKCTKIPFNEKRKVLAKRDTKDMSRRRTSLFTMPLPMTKSPMRRKRPAPESASRMNKSGIIITPKRSLKCHICQTIVPSAISLANHILAHKFDKEKPAA